MLRRAFVALASSSLKGWWRPCSTGLLGSTQGGVQCWVLRALCAPSQLKEDQDFLLEQELKGRSDWQGSVKSCETSWGLEGAGLWSVCVFTI